MKINVSWEKLRLFYIVAKYQNMTAAANHMNISQPALSRAITTIEERLKMTLFHRHARGLTLTEQGMILYDTLAKMSDQISIAERTLIEMEGKPKGPLTIGSSAGIISQLLLNDAQCFFNSYPDLELSIVLSDNTPDFSPGQIEAAVFPFIPDRDHDLIQEYLLSFQMKLYASSEYLERFGTPQTPKDLDHHRLIAYGTHPHPFENLDWHLNLGCPVGEKRRPYIQVNLGEKIRSLTRQGAGISSLAFHGNTPGRAMPELIQVLPDIKGPQIDFYYIYPKHLQSSLRIHALRDHFKSIIQKQKLDTEEGMNLSYHRK